MSKHCLHPWLALTSLLPLGACSRAAQPSRQGGTPNVAPLAPNVFLQPFSITSYPLAAVPSLSLQPSYTP